MNDFQAGQAFRVEVVTRDREPRFAGGGSLRGTRWKRREFRLEATTTTLQARRLKSECCPVFSSSTKRGKISSFAHFVMTVDPGLPMSSVYRYAIGTDFGENGLLLTKLNGRSYPTHRSARPCSRSGPLLLAMFDTRTSTSWPSRRAMPMPP